MKIRQGTGHRIALWTQGNPPLYVGIFEVVEVPDEWTNDARVDMALQGTVHHYTEKVIGRMVRGIHWLRISWAVTNKYNPESFTRYIYTPVVYEVNSGLLMRDEEGPRSLLLLLQEYPVESSVSVEQSS
jgi:hypothetical protein